MSFQGVHQFLLRLLEDLNERSNVLFRKKSCIPKNKEDIDELIEMIIAEAENLKSHSNLLKLILVIDEVDHFSKSNAENLAFKNFLTRFLQSKFKSCIVGIANSVELFKGDLGSTNPIALYSKLKLNSKQSRQVVNQQLGKER